ncbi:MAG: 3-deoxy-D-manno-octulosonic-acid transferase [Desulfobacteraceae bacterium Eth-SRB1]|nr:MAG: 3-deoxy-D-manno-octulosonic-acid transferase [Desulfobacteraceae bacterium Eth-SRB1]
MFFIAIVLGFPLIIPLVLVSHKRRKTVLQRLGIKRLPENIRKDRFNRPENRPVWVHALSVGEVLSSIELVKGLRADLNRRNIIFSVSTKTGFEIAGKLLKKHVDSIFYFPYDFLISVKHIARHVDPCLVLIVESDIWPNFLSEMEKREVPVILVNARLSERSFSGYGKIPFFSKRLFSFFTKICVQSGEDALRFSLLGVPSNKIIITGNIKFDQEYDLAPETEIEKLKQIMHIKPYQKILLAGSTHKGEEEIICDAVAKVKKRLPDIFLIITPRDPERAGSVCEICKAAGLFAVAMSDIENIGPEAKLNAEIGAIIVDKIGVLRKFYALADMAFIGGSLVKSGGHNPLEPAAYSKPVMFGYDMSDFRDIAHLLVESGGAVRVQDAESIYSVVSKLLTDDQKAGEMGKRALKVFNANKGAVEKTLNIVEDIL